MHRQDKWLAARYASLLRYDWILHHNLLIQDVP